MTMNSQTLGEQPWYKQGWPLFLFGLPAISVVVGIALYLIANLWHVDSIVFGDYSKDGKGVVVRDDRFRKAQSLGLSAHAMVREGMVSVRMSAAQEKDQPPELRLNIIHPTQDRFDQKEVVLRKEQDGLYSGPIKPLNVGRWKFQLEDESQTWSMTGDIEVPLVGRFKQADSPELSAYATVHKDAINAESTVYKYTINVELLSSGREKDLPATLRLLVIHPTRSSSDQQVLLQRGEDGLYSGPIEPLHTLDWQFQLENESRTWRMAGNAGIPAEMDVAIEPFQSDSINPAVSIRPSDS